MAQLWVVVKIIVLIKMELCHEKNNNGFRPGQTQIGLYKHRRWLEAGNFGFRKYRNCTVPVAKTGADHLSCYAKLLWAFVFAYAKFWFSHDVAQIVK